MNNELFTTACERASQEVLSLINEGYALVFEVRFVECKTAIMKLKHKRNSNTMKVRVCGNSWEIWKNNKLVKKEFV